MGMVKAIASPCFPLPVTSVAGKGPGRTTPLSTGAGGAEGAAGEACTPGAADGDLAAPARVAGYLAATEAVKE